MTCEPATSVIKKLGKIRRVSLALGVARQGVWKWTQPKPKGTGGTIPQRHHLAILDLARALDVPLTAADLLPKPDASCDVERTSDQEAA